MSKKHGYSSSLSRNTAMETHMPYGITQCYLPPSRGDILACGEVLWILATCLLRPVSRNSVLEELSVRKKKKDSHRHQGPLCRSSSLLRHFEPARVVRSN